MEKSDVGFGVGCNERRYGFLVQRPSLSFDECEDRRTQINVGEHRPAYVAIGDGPLQSTVVGHDKDNALSVLIHPRDGIADGMIGRHAKRLQVSSHYET
jgi:hypothetical protein